ncbi:MAG TPA: hypothetical protein DEG17_10350 [Cyanobacteria bacterium UBA11149]|nr:hypothetical protein [Cyanobacteria bacterium UBA11367]HBE58350.1 hypothetical protein [Cyanobacteria bacterium UBA11366]HBK62053.1 hypothetical protein [Cyanobacteria bacterium UBA11166]HBR73887.1 hypothetical protein [Cyanobacteria bacterium UBA11159]HBS71199.1 hypothetical protein [Cyanobacteria bacterium UBA11153]HBW89249.1 hypothetical protein [Cyanobacteria bacterium UBA11149]HCA94699.1 hypothetical protein [Cyanobacteria bacterium UBA9226]
MSQAQTDVNWILVSLTSPKKKDLVLKQIKSDENLPNLIRSEHSVYGEWLLLEVSDVQLVRERMQKISYIKKLERIKPEEASRMLGV